MVRTFIIFAYFCLYIHFHIHFLSLQITWIFPPKFELYVWNAHCFQWLCFFSSAHNSMQFAYLHLSQKGLRCPKKYISIHCKSPNKSHFGCYLFLGGHFRHKNSIRYHLHSNYMAFVPFLCWKSIPHISCVTGYRIGFYHPKKKKHFLCIEQLKCVCVRLRQFRNILYDSYLCLFFKYNTLIHKFDIFYWSCIYCSYPMCVLFISHFCESIYQPFKWKCKIF